MAYFGSIRWLTVCLISAILFSMAAVCHAQYTIYTFAGDGISGFSGDGGQATAAQVTSPWGICSDASGNVYIADYSNNRVRKINTGTGVITTFAGNGVGGYGGDGGQATAAQLDWPCGVYSDAAGNIYIGDAQNERIRKVATNGIITTVAGNGVSGFSGDGGPATAAEIAYPTGVRLDPAGDLIIADQLNHCIRKVTPGGIISTIAGNGIAGYSGDGGPATAAELYVSHVSSDASGNIYIADWFNNRVRFVNMGTGIITTIAGNGTGGYSGDGGPATAAELSQPGDCLMDASGKLWICDASNNRLRLVSAGIITTVAGNGIAGYSGDGGPATAAEISYPEDVCFIGSTIYFTDYANYRGRKLTGGALPVTLLSFTAEYEAIQNDVALNWATATEINNKEFTVEKSQDGANWLTVATLPGAGNSTKTLYYSTADYSPYQGVSYYRLKQTDFDGTTSLSAPQAVNVPFSSDGSVYPNPASGNATLQYTSAGTGTLNVEVTDLYGRQITSYTFNCTHAGLNNFQINSSALAPGLYFLKVIDNSRVLNLKFIKVLM